MHVIAFLGNFWRAAVLFMEAKHAAALLDAAELLCVTGSGANGVGCVRLDPAGQPWVQLDTCSSDIPPAAVCAALPWRALTTLTPSAQWEALLTFERQQRAAAPAPPPVPRPAPCDIAQRAPPPEQSSEMPVVPRILTHSQPNPVAASPQSLLQPSPEPARASQPLPLRQAAQRPLARPLQRAAAPQKRMVVRGGKIVMEGAGGTGDAVSSSSTLLSAGAAAPMKTGSAISPLGTGLCDGDAAAHRT